ncbi:MAG: 50S ribosomal protein L21 [Kiritimatiellae bacterium]|nr:50S ribosomal protein L21 [Kiritimatiellia bacterium]
MEPYAVIETGGKQYRVQKGDVLDVELLDAEVGHKVTISEVLAVSDGKELQVGTPHVKGAKVTAEVVEFRRGPKLVAFKKKRRKGFHKKIGHRQNLTRVRIVEM